MFKYVGLSKNKMLKLKQALEGLSPIIKNLLFPPAMKDRLIEIDREGNIPSVAKKMLLVTKREGIKKDYRMVWRLQNPGHMIERLVILSIKDGSFRDSQTFSTLIDQMVVVWGCDKSSNDTGLAARIAN